MPDEPITPQDETAPEVAPSPAPAAEQAPAWANEEVEVAGRRMTLGNLQNSYVESERRMRQLEAENLENKQKLQEYSWAPEVLEEYRTNPKFAEGFDRLYQEPESVGGQGKTHGLTPELQQLQHTQTRLEMLENERSFDRIRAQGLKLTPDMETTILTERMKNPALSAEQAYKALFFEQVLSDVKQQVAAETAQTITKGRQYRQPPSGTKPTQGAPDLKKMSEQERDAYALERIASEIDFSGNW